MINYLDEIKNVVGIYLDLTKAFDAVQHIPPYLRSSIIMVLGEWQMKTALFKTGIFVTEIYNSIYVCYLSSVSYTHYA